jgi:hypothetical protein
MTACRWHRSNSMRAVEPGAVPLQLEILPDAGHGLDDPRFANPVPPTPARFFKGTTQTYSKAAHESDAVGHVDVAFQGRRGVPNSAGMRVKASRSSLMITWWVMPMTLPQVSTR